MVRDTWIRDLMHDVTTDILVEYIMLWLVIDKISFDPADQRADEFIGRGRQVDSIRPAQHILCSFKVAWNRTSRG
jgi:hypothetical protein